MSRSSLPVVGIPCDVVTYGLHPFHGVGEKYINAVTHGAGVLPLLIPAFGPGVDLEPASRYPNVEEILDSVDGLFFPGSPSNVEPHHYGGTESRQGTLHDAQRDTIALPLLRGAIAEGKPVLAVCRGLQELNVAVGGTLHQHIQEVAGLNDHREDKTLDREGQYGPAHEVMLAPGGLLAKLAKKDRVMVNSLHGQGIERLGDNLVVEATALDGLVEAVRLDNTGQYAVGVQWHPEWRFRQDPLSVALFRSFGDAVRAAR